MTLLEEVQPKTKDTPKWNQLYFDNWVHREGLDLIKGHKVDNVYTQPLKYWARTGGSAVQIVLDGTGEMNAAYICEIPAGKHLEPQRHLYEELVFVLSGRGSTSVWYDGRPKNTFEWQTGSLFAIPLNARYQHFNASGREPARYIAVTTAPIMMNLIRDERFIFENDATFPDRYLCEEDYFSGKYEIHTFTGWDVPTPVAFSSFFPDIFAIPFQDTGRGANAQGVNYELANGVLGAHTLQIPGGTFTKLHRHGPGAHVIWLKGEGYSMMWPEGGEMTQERWGPGAMYVPPSWWWHQHCVVSQEPAVHLALKLSSKRNKVNTLSNNTVKSVKQGGSQLDYDDIPPETMAKLVAIFTEECRKRGTTPNLEPILGA